MQAGNDDVFLSTLSDPDKRKQAIEAEASIMTFHLKAARKSVMLGSVIALAFMAVQIALAFMSAQLVTKFGVGAVDILKLSRWAPIPFVGIFFVMGMIELSLYRDAAHNRKLLLLCDYLDTKIRK